MVRYDNPLEECRVMNIGNEGTSTYFFLFMYFSFSFICCRWVADQAVAERLIDIWPNIKKVDASWQKLSKSKQPKSKSYNNLHNAVVDLFTPAKLNFFSYIASFFQPFLALYQTDNPMVPFLFDDLMALVKKVMMIIFKSDIVHGCTSASAIKKIDFDNKDNFLKVKEMSLGFATEKCISDLKKKDLASKQQIAQFFNDAIEIIKAILMKLVERSPLGTAVVKYAGVFDPRKLSSEDIDHENLSWQFKRLLSVFMKLNILAANSCDRALAEFQEFLQNECKTHLNRLKSFNHKENRLDDLFFNYLGIQKYKNLSYVIKIILTLSHGQAAVEWGFSVNKSIIRVNMKEESIVAKKIIRDYMIANSLKPHTVEISNKLILSCSTARQKYRQHNNETKKQEEKKKKESEKQLLTNEIIAYQKESDRLKETCEGLDKDFVRLVKEGEKKKDFDYIYRATALKRKCDEKEIEIKNLNDKISMLKAKKQKM